MVLGPDGWGCCLFCCFCFSVVVATSLPQTNTKLTLRKIHLKKQHHDIHQTLTVRGSAVHALSGVASTRGWFWARVASTRGWFWPGSQG